MRAIQLSRQRPEAKAAENPPWKFQSFTDPLSQVVFFHPFPLMGGGGGVVSTPLLNFAN